MNLPIEIVSKIMIFHSNIQFNKNELVDFVEDWNYMKSFQNQTHLEYEDWMTLEMIAKSNKMLRKYYKSRFNQTRYNETRYNRMQSLYDEYSLRYKP
jgi:hypothetical protein